jgi:16S rRNA (uracil1498-N3)-methyltransferase
MTRKKLHRFFIDTIPAGEVFDIRNEHIVHQIKTVLRLEAGEEIILFEHGGDDNVVSIVDITKDYITVRVQSTEKHAQNTRELVAAISIVKRDNFELIVQKLTELGVHTIVPIISARTIKQSIRLDRLALISQEAVEQCGGNNLVHITEPMTLKESFKAFPVPGVVCSPEGSTGVPTFSEKMIMYIGPEGGWSETDEMLFTEHHTKALSLGPRILRTETAAIVGAYKLLWN